MNYRLLEKINSPEDLKKLEISELIELASEIREYILDVTSVKPGHVGANLGVVEITIALHYVFNSPYDKIVWDVGHQCYTHKIITGRKDKFYNLREKGGISGFPDPNESDHDSFISGHSSTSVSVALGIVVADKLKNITDRNVIAFVGDGSMTSGQLYEALLNVGNIKPNLLIVLNDNRMSISPNKSPLSEYLLDIATSKTYNKIKQDVWRFLGKFQLARNIVQKIDNSLKTLILKHSNIFEAIGIRYFGPVDGHDLITLIEVLKSLKNIPGPKLLHVLTQKGKGYKPAEEKKDIFHSPGRFNRQTGEIIIENGTDKPQDYQYVLGETLIELAQKYDNFVVITPAMTIGSSLVEFSKKFPERFFDVGIAEQHAVTFAASLAYNNIKPFCVIYSTFLQRAIDQVIHDISIINSPVVLCIDRGGLVGNDGATHQGIFDIAYLRYIPNIILAAPKDEIELRNFLYTSLFLDKPIAIRYPREKGIHVNWKQQFQKIPLFKSEKIQDGEDVAILFYGALFDIINNVNKNLKQNGINIGIYNMRFAKPLDYETLHSICQTYKYIITIENGTIIGGFGSAISEFITMNNYKVILKTLGIPDNHIKHSSIDEQKKECGLTADALLNVVYKILKNKKFEY